MKNQQVIDCKENQLQAIQTTVKSTDEDSVKELFKSYSDTVQENFMVREPEPDSLSFGTLKQVIRSVAQEEGCRNDMIIFGVQEPEQNSF